MRLKDKTPVVCPSSFILHPSSFILHPSSFKGLPPIISTTQHFDLAPPTFMQLEPPDLDLGSKRPREETKIAMKTQGRRDRVDERWFIEDLGIGKRLLE